LFSKDANSKKLINLSLKLQSSSLIAKAKVT